MIGRRFGDGQGGGVCIISAPVIYWRFQGVRAAAYYPFTKNVVPHIDVAGRFFDPGARRKKTKRDRPNKSRANDKDGRWQMSWQAHIITGLPAMYFRGFWAKVWPAALFKDGLWSCAKRMICAPFGRGQA